MTLEDTVIGHHLSSISSGHPGGRPFQLSGSERRPQPIFPRSKRRSIDETVAMLDHLSIQCADVSSSATFYDRVLAPLGVGRVMDFGQVIGFGIPPMPDFWVGPHTTGEGFRESHIAFTAPDRPAVRAFFDAAKAAGAEVLHEPRVWPEYHANYYGAFVRDPDGNNVEAVCHQGEGQAEPETS